MESIIFPFFIIIPILRSLRVDPLFFITFSITVPPVAVAVASLELPTHVPYLLIGAGTSSVAAFRAIKSRDPTAKVHVQTDSLTQHRSLIFYHSFSVYGDRFW